MKNITLVKVSEIEKLKNTNLLLIFSNAFAACDTSHIEKMLHTNGVFFGKMNKTKAVGFFYKLFFSENGVHSKFNIDINRGFALGHFSGQEVLEFRWSDFDPFINPPTAIMKPFGSKENKVINEKVIRFAFTFKKGKIFTISIPTKFTDSLSNLISEN
jgi:hypothetical protein